MELVNIYKSDWNIVEKWRDKNKVKTKIVEFVNYFYFLVEDKDKVLSLQNTFEKDITLQIQDKVYKTIDGRNVYRAYVKWYFSKFVKFLKSNGIELFESDLSVYIKYVIRNKNKFSSKRRIVYLDIETNNCNTPMLPEKEITAIGLYDNFFDKYFIFTFNKRKDFFIREDVEIKVFNDEIEMLNGFINFVRENNPDIIAGWHSNDFDVPYIINRCKYLEVDIDRIALGNSKDKICCWRDGNKMILDIHGIECLDLIPILKRITAYMYGPSNYNLSTVCQFYIGEEYKKMDFDLGRYKDDFLNFLKYNLRDVELLRILDEKMGILNYAITLQCEVCPISLPHVTHNTMLLELFLKLKYPNIVLPDKKNEIEISGCNVILKDNLMRVKIKGAFTGKMEDNGNEIKFVNPTPGVYKNVEVFDFKGMYSSIYSTFNLSQDTLSNDGELVIDNIEAVIQERDGNTFRDIKDIKLISKFNLDAPGLIPQIINNVRAERQKYKDILKTINKKENPIEYQKYKALEDVYKLIGNAFYGVFSYNGFRLYNPNINGAITKIARDCLIFVNKKLKDYGMEAIYGDTDSLMIWNKNNKIDADTIIEKLNNDLKLFVCSINPKLRKYFNMQLDKAYSFKTLVLKNAKKRYFGILDNGEFVTKGWEIVRRDTPDKIKLILKQLFIDLLTKDSEYIRSELLRIKKYIKTLGFKELGISLTISQDLEDYKTNVMHIRAVKYSNINLGTNFNRGDKIKLIFVNSTGKYPMTDVIAITDDMDIPDDFKVDYNKFYDFLIGRKLKLLEDVKEFNLSYILNENKTLLDYL